MDRARTVNKKIAEQDISYTEALNPHSVKISVNAKGETSYEIKSYGKTTEEAMETTVRIHDSMKKLYNK